MILKSLQCKLVRRTAPDPITYYPDVMASHIQYFPSLPEISISVGIFSAGILAFGLAARYLPLFEKNEELTNDESAQ